MLDHDVHNLLALPRVVADRRVDQLSLFRREEIWDDECLRSESEVEAKLVDRLEGIPDRVKVLSHGLDQEARMVLKSIDRAALNSTCSDRSPEFPNLVISLARRPKCLAS